jgi:hypothetical protein
MGTRGAPIPVTKIGSGGATLLKLMEEPRRRSSLRRLVEASARNRITPHIVSDYLLFPPGEAYPTAAAHARLPAAVSPRFVAVAAYALYGRADSEVQFLKKDSPWRSVGFPERVLRESRLFNRTPESSLQQLNARQASSSFIESYHWSPAG